MKMLCSTAPALLPIATAISLALATSVGHAQSDSGSAAASGRKLASLHSVQQSHPHPSDTRHQHPLQPLLAWAEAGQERIREEIRDYTCVLVSRERLAGDLGPRIYMSAKVRHEQVENGEVKVPFSLYLKFLGPQRMKDREVLFVAGQNDNKLLVRKGGRQLASLTASLEPDCILAMAENRYPVTEFGFLRLTERLAEVGRQEIAYGECEVDVFDQYKTKKRVCTRIEVKHPIQRDHFQYCLARVYVDNDLQIPIRFEAYHWPHNDDEDPILLEEYTYHNLKLNVGLTDADFDRDHPDYQFGGE